MRLAAVLILATAFTLGVSPLTVASPIWVEVGDAGQLLGTAQVPQGTGPLTMITGEITGILQSGTADIFEIFITGGATFSALAKSTQFPVGIDPQLFLFDSQGKGVYANDDTFPPDPFSFGAALLPANHPLTPIAAGSYYLAISAPFLDPFSAFGSIFPCVGCIPSLVAGPTGPGGGAPLTGWSGTTFSQGAYEITLTGAEFPSPAVVPEVATTVLIGIGFSGFLARYRSNRRQRLN